jgi:hypothetical protein
VEALDLRKGFIKEDFELGPRDVEVCLWIFGRSDDELDGGGGADVHFCIICGGEDGVGFKARCDVGSAGFLGGCGLARGRGDGGGFDFCSLSDWMVVVVGMLSAQIWFLSSRGSLGKEVKVDIDIVMNV